MLGRQLRENVEAQTQHHGNAQALSLVPSPAALRGCSLPRMPIPTRSRDRPAGLSPRRPSCGRKYFFSMKQGRSV